MPSCAAINCTNKQVKGCGKTFHLYPSSRPSLLQKWTENTRRDQWEPKRTSVLCSDHFTEECFDRTGQTTRLRENAVPTIFDFPSLNQKLHREKGKTHKSRKASCKILKPKAVNVPTGVGGYNDVLQGPILRPDGVIAKTPTCITGNCFMLPFPNSPTPAGIMVNPTVLPFRGSNLVGTQTQTGTRTIVNAITGSVATGKPHIPTGVIVSCDEAPSGLPTITATPVPTDLFMNHKLWLGMPYGVDVQSSTSDVRNLQPKNVLSPMQCPNVKVIKSDHAYYLENPRTVKHKLDRASTQLHKMKRRLKTSQQKYRRLSKRHQALLVFVKSLQFSVPVIQDWSDEEPCSNEDDG